MKNAGWKYAVEGEENGVTLFSALQESPRRRAVAGFYGATDDALVVAAMEILPNDGIESDAQRTQSNVAADTQTKPDDNSPVFAAKNSANGNSIIGTWYDGYVSMVGFTPQVGPLSYTPGRSHRFEYVFHPNGTYTFSGIMNNTVYSCTTTIFNDQRGTYKISGDQITLTKTKNFFRRTDSCSASNNMERNYTLGSETYAFSVTRNDRGKEQVCFNTGESTPCYEREQK